MKGLKPFFTFCFLLFTFSSFAQYNPSKINKKAVEAYDKGIEKAQAGNYKDAIESLQEAIQRDANYVDAYLSMAGVYGQLKDYKQSTTFYEKAFALDSNYTSDFRLPYSINLAGMGEFEKSTQRRYCSLIKTQFKQQHSKGCRVSPQVLSVCSGLCKKSFY